MKTRRLFRAFAVATIGLSACPIPLALGQDTSTVHVIDVPDVDPTPPGDSSTDFEVTIEVPGTSTPVDEVLPISESFIAQAIAERSHPLTSSGPPPCGEYLYFEIDAAYNLIIWSPPKCVEVLTCGSERVDDVYFGRISGTSALTGAYAGYLNEVVGTTASTPGGVTDVDVDATNTSLLASGLGDAPEPLALATFRWCRNAAGEFERSDPVWAASFSWDTTFDAEYNRDEILAGLFEQVRVRLTAYRPDIAAAPPVSVGHTYVKFPTWLWINNPVETVTVASDQDLRHIRASLRATLTEVAFDFGGAAITCSPSELVPYIDGETDPIDDVGPCHQVFDQVTSFDLSATLNYDIEQRISTRRYATHPWTHGAWEPHTTETLEASGSAGRYEVHELLSLNVNRELELASD